jgi:hypothetical protein
MVGMNLFAVHSNPVIAARSLGDRHVVRMKVHKSRAIIESAASRARGPPASKPRRGAFVQALPDACKTRSSVEAYRRYDIGEKARFASWREPGRPPHWWPAGLGVAGER